MDVRSCLADDLVKLRQAWPSADDVHATHFEEQHDGQAAYLVAWRQEEPLGSALIQWRGPVGVNARAAFPECVAITHLQVRPGLRGSGVGSHLIRTAETLAVTRGRPQVGLAVGTENPRAASLYERLGYQRTGAIDVSEYDWTDSHGQRHHEVETDEFLIKVL